MNEVKRSELRKKVTNKHGNPDFGAIALFEDSLLPMSKKTDSKFFWTNDRRLSEDINAYCYATIKEKMIKLAKAGLIRLKVIGIKGSVDEIVTQYEFGVEVLCKN